jgi:hypothetical protein
MTGRGDRTTPTDTPFAHEGELDPGDATIVGAAEAEAGPDPADRIPDTLADDDDLYQDVSARPASEVTAGHHDGGYDETVDGLSDIEEEVRRQAEDRVPGDGLDMLP